MPKNKPKPKNKAAAQLDAPQTPQTRFQAFMHRVAARFPRRALVILIALGVVTALSMYQAAQPIRKVTAEVDGRHISLALRENEGIIFGEAVEGDRKNNIPVATLTPEKSTQLGLPLVTEKQLRDAELTTEKETGVCMFKVAPGRTIGFDPQSFTWRSRSIQQ